MATNVSDFKLASTAAGFTLGFGVLCVWNAIQQTRAVRSPLRSVYIFMVWGEIVANLAIGIIGWLFLDGVLSPRQVNPSLGARAFQQLGLTSSQCSAFLQHSFPLGVRSSAAHADYHQSNHCYGG